MLKNKSTRKEIIEHFYFTSLLYYIVCIKNGTYIIFIVLFS